MIVASFQDLGKKPVLRQMLKMDVIKTKAASGRRLRVRRRIESAPGAESRPEKMAPLVSATEIGESNS